MNYKYNFHYLLRQLSIENYEQAMQFFPHALSISKDTWRKYIYIKQSDGRELRPDQLRKIATFFDCSIDDLINKSNTPRNLKEEFKNFKSC